MYSTTIYGFRAVNRGEEQKGQFTLGPQCEGFPNFRWYIRRHGSDVYLGMYPIKMAAPILMYYRALAKQRNGGGEEQLKATDSLISWRWTRQHTQRQPEVHVGGKHHRLFLCHYSFHILFLFLPTKFLRATSAWHRPPMDASRLRGLGDVHESLRYEHRFQSNSNSVGGTQSLSSHV